MLVGPAALHARVQRIYEFFLEAAAERIELQIDLHQERAAAPGVSGTSETTSYLVSLPAAAWREISSTQTIPAVLDYDVEIAHGSAVSDPISKGVESGLRLHLQAVPAAGGVILSTILRRGSDAEVFESGLGLGAIIATENTRAATVTLAEQMQSYSPVSYTHLTLPTIYSV